MKFIKIAFTTPEISEYDILNILKILESDTIDFLHLRKPEASESQIREIVENIPQKFRNHIVLHDRYELVNEYGIGGVHLNRRNSVPPNGVKRISCSCHSLGEIKKNMDNGFSYITLSPIFPSISKPGYHSDFNLEELRKDLSSLSSLCPPIIALGGIEPKLFRGLKDIGFSGAAMLGWLYDENIISDDKISEIQLYSGIL